MKSNKPGRIVLIGEDPPEVRRYLETAITALGYSVQVFASGDDLLSILSIDDTNISAVLLDVELPNRYGLDVLQEIRAAHAKLPVILMAGPSSIREAVAAIKSGATDFLCKPLTQEDLIRILTEDPETCDTALNPAARAGSPSNAFIGSGPGVREIQLRAAQVGRSGLPVLIQGETGSGKEVLARELHNQSPRANKAFLKLNCAALPPELVESELFGYERGAFTGAFQKKTGIFELADGGTILLDEIGDMDIRLQAKLLQVLQDQEFRRIGGKESIKVDVRIIAATHRDLDKAIYDGTFREDLYYRLSVIVLSVPSLRDRAEDIVPLGEFLLRKCAAQGIAIPTINMSLRHAMLAYDWPGNVRELENYMRKLLVFQDPDAIARELQVRMERRRPSPVRPSEKQVVSIGKTDGISVLEQVTKVKQQSEIDAIMAVLDSTRWNRKQAASILKIDYKSLLYRMKKLGIDDRPSAPAEPVVEERGRASAAG